MTPKAECGQFGSHVTSLTMPCDSLSRWQDATPETRRTAPGCILRVGGQEEGAHGEGGDSSPQKKSQLSAHETDALDTRAEVTARLVVVGGGWGCGGVYY